MRHGMVGLLLALLFISAAPAQDKKKDKEPDKKKDLGKKEDPKSGTPPEISEILGKSFREWQKEIHSPDPSKREAAMKAVVQFGPDRAYDAVGDILQELEKHNKTPIDLAARVNGTMALNTIFKFKKDPDPKHIQRTIAIYRVFLKDEQVIMKMRALQGLFYLGPACRELLPEVRTLAAAKGSLTWEIRKEAVQALGFMGFTETGANPVVIGDLVRALDDTSYQVRVAAMFAIAQISNGSTLEQKGQLAAKLNSVLKDEPDMHVIITAHLTLMTLEKKVSANHLNPIIKQARSKDPSIRLVAIQSLAMTGKDGKAAVPMLLETISDPEVTFAVAAINSLVSMEVDEVIPHLKKIMADKAANPVLRDAAEDGLEIIEFREKMRKEMKDKEKKDKKDKK